MTHSGLPVNWLRVFEVAARHLSLSAAAVELNVTPAAVSQQVRLLENRLGQKLFLRHSRGLRLTPAGEALAPTCRESFERLDSALTELFGRGRREQLVIRVALGFARQWLLDRLAAFSRRHPAVPIRLIASVWDGSPPDTNVDLDIRVASGPIPGLVWHQLTHDEIFPVCSPALAMAAPRIRRPSDLRHHPLLTTIGFNQGWPHWFAAAGMDSPPAASGIEFDSMRLALETAALGHGVALARSSYAEDMLRGGQLRALFTVRVKATDNVFLTHAQGLSADSPAGQVREWILRRTARRLPALTTAARPLRSHG